MAKRIWENHYNYQQQLGKANKRADRAKLMRECAAEAIRMAKQTK